MSDVAVQSAVCPWDEMQRVLRCSCALENRGKTLKGKVRRLSAFPALQYEGGASIRQQ